MLIILKSDCHFFYTSSPILWIKLENELVNIARYTATIWHLKKSKKCLTVLRLLQLLVICLHLLCYLFKKIEKIVTIKYFLAFPTLGLVRSTKFLRYSHFVLKNSLDHNTDLEFLWNIFSNISNSIPKNSIQIILKWVYRIVLFDHF